MPSPQRPNIVYILVDDMGYGDFSRFNDGLSATPRLDALFDEGLSFSQHYTASPVCNPSRAALLTGRYPHRTGSIDTLEWRGLERLALRERTLADILQHTGYATGLIGKWHLGAFDPRYRPTARGFDEAVCFRGGMHDYYDWRIEHGDAVRRADGRYLTDVWTSEACAFIERHAREPFFLHLTYNAPHTPLQAPDGDIRHFDDREGLGWGVRMLYAMLRRMDRGIEQVLETLDRLGLRDNTLVLFSSDNGPQMGDRGDYCLDRFNCNLNGAKGTTWEGGIRVPLIMRWPAALPAGVENHAMIHMCDMYPTLASLAGIDLPAGQLPLDGVDVAPVIRGERDRGCERRFWQWNRYVPMVQYNSAMRDGDWKLVRPMVEPMNQAPCSHPWLRIAMYEHERLLREGLVTEPPPLPDPLPEPAAPELYNIREDPLEREDLAEREPARLRRMLGELDEWFAEVERERATIDDVW